jgi:predicted TIM-barrel fold metal-dependent hydrolase
MDYARELVRVAGPDRLAWASDCPFVGHENQFAYKSTMDWLEECVPDALVRAKIFGGTALKLYFGEG